MDWIEWDSVIIGVMLYLLFLTIYSFYSELRSIRKLLQKIAATRPQPANKEV